MARKLSSSEKCVALFAKAASQAAPEALRPKNIVKFTLGGMPSRWSGEQIKKYAKQYPFKQGEHVLFLGEIENMPGHCIVVKRNGIVMWGYHTDNFEKCTEEDL